MTVGQYQQLYEIAKSTDDETEKAIQSVAVLTGKTPSEVEDMPLHEFNRVNSEIVKSINSLRLNTKPVSFLKANGRMYQVNYKIATITAGQNAEVNAWLKEKDWITNMDKILASVCVEIKRYGWVKLPVKKRRPHQDIAADMQDVNFSEAYGCVVFFCSLFTASIKGILPFLETEMMKRGKTMEEVQTFQMDLMKTLDGFTTANG